MPIITAYTDHPSRPYVRVEINWADTPSVTHAGVSRVDVETGECTPLRPYICYNGDELLLSCGHGTFWDTEAPFDRPFYYVTTSTEAPCLPAQPLFFDGYSRDLVDSWGSTESGSLGPLAYALSGGTNPGNYDVNGGKGRMALTTDTANRTAVVDLGRTDFDLYANLSTNQTATGQDALSCILARFVDTSNYYIGGFIWAPGGSAFATIARAIGGVETTVAFDPGIGGYSPDIEWAARFYGSGTNFKLKVWPGGTLEPEAWTLEVTDTPQPLAGTQVGILGRRDAGSTNVGMVLSADNFMAVEECAPCVPVTVDTSLDPITLDNDGRFWLKDPVRPCNDRPVPLCAPDAPLLPSCGADGAITFVEVGAEIYADNSLRLRPMNRRRAISMTRPRSDVTTSLVLETTTFTARDEVLELVAPGTPLLFQGPSEYGVPDRYMAIGAVSVERQLPDHRIQFRKETLPYEAVDRPAGPSQGICGTRVADICALYPTWDDLAAAGFTWDDLVRGAASPESANPNRRTWDDVEAEFADWDAVEAGGRTWTGLEVGD